MDCDQLLENFFLFNAFAGFSCKTLFWRNLQTVLAKCDSRMTQVLRQTHFYQQTFSSLQKNKNRVLQPLNL